MLALQYKETEYAETPPDYSEAKVIAKDLGYLPLALDQAGAYISSQKLTLTGYREKFLQKLTYILQERWIKWGYERSVVATWEISFEAIRKERPEAADLLLLCGFLANDDIFEAMLLKLYEGEIHSTLHTKQSIDLLLRIELQ